MIKKHKSLLILTSLVSLLPILVGLLLWDKLPEQVPTHWGIHGEVDGWSSKSFAVFFMPCMMLVMHWICVLASHLDPKRRNYHPKAFRLVLWICPGISLLISTMIYCVALGYPLRAEVLISFFVGLLFLIIGNLMPKMKQSYTMGIKLPWTLDNEENWNRTHRMAGKLWVGGGILIMATAFLGIFWVLLGVLALMVLLPTIYSYCLYRKQAEHP